MQTLHFEERIVAPVTRVWKRMLDQESYRQWTRAFHPGSYYEGGWMTGDEIRFLAKNDDGSTEGMVSRIKENREMEFISIEHLGVVRNQVVDTESAAVRAWAPAYENYLFVDLGDITMLKVDMQVADEHREMFEQMWPKAMNALKTLCEKT